jgi:hypothetical protein
MKIFANCHECGEPIYLDDIRERRIDYPHSITLECSNGHIDAYHRTELEAEVAGNGQAAGTIVGGAAGALAGPIGVVVGAGLGNVLGQNRDQTEQERVERFYGRDQGPFE